MHIQSSKVTVSVYLLHYFSANCSSSCKLYFFHAFSSKPITVPWKIYSEITFFMKTTCLNLTPWVILHAKLCFLFRDINLEYDPLPLLSYFKPFSPNLVSGHSLCIWVVFFIFLFGVVFLSRKTWLKLWWWLKQWDSQFYHLYVQSTRSPSCAVYTPSGVAVFFHFFFTLANNWTQP